MKIINVDIDNTLLVFVASVYGYVVAFVFQYGYLHYFDISYRFIDIAIPNLIISIAGTLLMALLISNLSPLYRVFTTRVDFNNVWHRYRYYWAGTGLVLFILLLFVYGIGTKIQSIVPFVVAFLVIRLITVDIPSLMRRIFRFKKYRTYKSALTKTFADIDRRQASDRHTGQETFAAKYAYQVTTVAFGLVVALSAGRYFASLQNNLYVYKINSDGSKSLIIEKVGDGYLLKRYSRSSHTFKSGVEIVKQPESISFDERVMINIRQ